MAKTRIRLQQEQFERVFLAAPVKVNDSLVVVVVVSASREPYESTRDIVLIGLLGLGVTVHLNPVTAA